MPALFLLRANCDHARELGAGSFDTRRGLHFDLARKCSCGDRRGDLQHAVPVFGRELVFVHAFRGVRSPAGKTRR